MFVDRWGAMVFVGSVGAMVFVGSVGGDGWEGGSVGAMGGKVERDVR